MAGNPVTFKLAKTGFQSSVEPETATTFVVVPAGSSQAEVGSSDGLSKNSIDLDVEQKQATSIFVSDHSLKGQVVSNEVNQLPEGTSSVRIIGDADLVGYTSTVKQPTGESVSNPLSLDSKPGQGPSGTYVVQIKDKAGKMVASSDVQADAQKAYTVFVAMTKHGVLAKALINNPTRRPVTMGASN